MSSKYIQILGVAVSAVYFVFIAIFLYLAEPRSLADISTKAASAVQDVTTKGQVFTGTYQVDAVKFTEGLRSFRENNFVAARDRFEKADPEGQDARTQFYIAYSYYRQGWGRFTNDDELFTAGLKQLERVEQLDPNFVASDDDLKLKRTSELKHEMQEGLRVTLDDLDPTRLVRDRK